MPIRERIVVVELFDERDVPLREPATELETWRGCGPERGQYEDQRPVEYIPPEHSRAA